MWSCVHLGKYECDRWQKLAISSWSIKDLTLCTIELSHNCTITCLVWDMPNLVSYGVLTLITQADRLTCVPGWGCDYVCATIHIYERFAVSKSNDVYRTKALPYGWYDGKNIKESIVKMKSRKGFVIIGASYTGYILWVKCTNLYRVLINLFEQPCPRSWTCLGISHARVDFHKKHLGRDNCAVKLIWLCERN